MQNSKAKLSKSSPALVPIASKSVNGKRPPKQAAGSKKVLSDGKRKLSPRVKINRRIVRNSDKGSNPHRYPYFIREEGVDHTPKSLLDSDFPTIGDQVIHVCHAAYKRPHKATRQYSIDSQSMHSLASRYSVSSTSRVSIVSMSRLHSIDTFPTTRFTFSSLVEDEEETELKLEQSPSVFRLREDPPPKKMEIVTKFSVNLSETDTMFQLTLPSCVDELESENGKETVRLNDQFESVSSTNRALSHTATQTSRAFTKHLQLFVPRVSRVDSSAFASVWDIYDSYLCEHRKSILSTYSRDEGEVDHIVEARQEDNYTRKFEYLNQTFDSDFLNSLMLMERMIGKNTFGEKQCDFQGLLTEDPLSLDAKCNYSLVHLWTFSAGNPERKRKVTSLCWSSENQNILAVGYGKFKYSDDSDGLVCVWNVKNPQNPERCYQFKDPVTCVSFSHHRPQILAVSFYSGLVLLLDIISRTQLVRASNSHYPLYYPVWQVLWYSHEPLDTGQYLITCSQSGRVFRYKKTKFFSSKKIMTVSRPHGIVQGVYRPRKCYSRKIISRLNPSAEVLVLHPDDPLLYLVGTSEGCVYICSINHRHDYVDVFVAHNGPVYSIQFNPFCTKVFLTCGADYCVRVWAEGIFDPLITLESGLTPVQGALWNPLHSTVIVSITGSHIEIWDIRRRTSKPKSSTVSPSKSFNTVIQFSANLYNLCVGDADGNVHVMALTEMPFSPVFQEEVLAQSIQNALISHPHLLKRLWDLGPPFFKSVKTYKERLTSKFSVLHKEV